ncbi:hypothetical protein [Nostoc sp. NMS8]|uniref:hypothetical protein n=1 Tax=Nostoc sp. NMS8 TaxID=2815392 RepID=UPI0025CD0E5D|nr:hypothetical protein [Nostoc sp. NMS8]MBN3963160.1 hypothetical protein [Nostoc sp. NMS8]
MTLLKRVSYTNCRPIEATDIVEREVFSVNESAGQSKLSVFVSASRREGGKNQEIIRC